jgi:hypothetical protein
MILQMKRPGQDVVRLLLNGELAKRTTFSVVPQRGVKVP